MNKYLESRVNAIRNSLLATYEGGADLPNAVKGVEREAFLSEFLTKVFPPHYRFVGGAIIDSLSNNISGQVDIAVLLPSAPSFPMPAAGDQRLVLAENVGSVIEVKSDIAAQWGQVMRTTKKVKSLHKFVSNAPERDKVTVTKIPVVAVGYRGWKNVWALKKHWEDEPKSDRPDAVYLIREQAFVSESLQAEKAAALVAFVAYLFRALTANEQIQTDLLRYVGPIANM